MQINSISMDATQGPSRIEKLLESDKPDDKLDGPVEVEVTKVTARGK